MNPRYFPKRHGVAKGSTFPRRDSALSSTRITKRASQGEGTAGERAVLSFRGITNVGRGAAFDTWLRVDHDPAQRYFMASAHRLSLIGVNRELPLPGRIIVWFQNALPPDSPVIVIPLRLTFRDSRGNVYDTLFQLDVLRAHAKSSRWRT